MKNSKIKNAVINAVILFLLTIPFSAGGVLIEGNDTEVINEIKVEVSTGDNKIQSPPNSEGVGGEGGEGGQVIEGESKSSVEIKTIINGEEVESISTQSNEGSIRVESRVEINEESGIKNPAEGEARPDLSGRQESGIRNLGLGIKSWWLDFVENLKSIFLGIFNIFG
jgi:hypothetical protein